VKAALPLTGVRGFIAEHMHRSLGASAQLTAMGEMDVTDLVRMRQADVNFRSQIGTRIPYTALMVFLVARTLREVPIMNASVVGKEVVLWEDIHIGVAVPLPEGEYDAGLLVPVIRHADRLSIVETSRAVKDLSARAVTGRLNLDEMTGGTFTISHVGGFGKAYFFLTPIINQPQCAILGVGPILERPVVRDGQIVPRSIMNWSLTFDHRMVNGSPVGKFMRRLERLVRNPQRTLV
jgi:pyruvate dehydrogenase E2 component (dihydrolipoamide acetyltransferase)/2-oxoglutarate dehydrogenase E2 component (dihydrolipoamide succinyltransferase)